MPIATIDKPLGMGSNPTSPGATIDELLAANYQAYSDLFSSREPFAPLWPGWIHWPKHRNAPRPPTRHELAWVAYANYLFDLTRARATLWQLGRGGPSFASSETDQASWVRQVLRASEEVDVARVAYEAMLGEMRELDLPACEVVTPRMTFEAVWGDRTRKRLGCKL